VSSISEIDELDRQIEARTQFINDELVRFQTAISALKYRTEVSVEHTAKNGEKGTLCWASVKGSWRLFWDPKGPRPEMRDLTQMSLRQRIAAIEALPALLEAIRQLRLARMAMLAECEALLPVIRAAIPCAVTPPPPPAPQNIRVTEGRSLPERHTSESGGEA
jgi:hypothetical protein